ncbi:MAG: hypothetical protein AAB553_02845 [Patescibacteria group bacterium]
MTETNPSRRFGLPSFSRRLPDQTPNSSADDLSAIGRARAFPRRTFLKAVAVVSAVDQGSRLVPELLGGYTSHARFLDNSGEGRRLAETQAALFCFPGVQVDHAKDIASFLRYSSEASAEDPLAHPEFEQFGAMGYIDFSSLGVDLDSVVQDFLKHEKKSLKKVALMGGSAGGQYALKVAAALRRAGSAIQFTHLITDCTPYDLSDVRGSSVAKGVNYLVEETGYQGGGIVTAVVYGATRRDLAPDNAVGPRVLLDEFSELGDSLTREEIGIIQDIVRDDGMQILSLSPENPKADAAVDNERANRHLRKIVGPMAVIEERGLEGNQGHYNMLENKKPYLDAIGGWLKKISPRTRG